jgi:hypothetical protein
MVILGGLEIVAAGYLIHKHQQNKKDKARLEEEEAYLEEEEYRKRHSSSNHRHRSHSRRRHSRERPHSYDGKYDYRRESPRPMPAKSAMRPAAAQQAPPPSMAQQSMRPPPPYSSVPTATPQPPQDIKYGWTDEPTPQQQPPQQPQHDPNFPPTGWPSHWPQSQTPDPGARLGAGPQQRGGESSRGRSDRRATSASPHIRFAVPRRQRSPSFSPPPSYRE